MLRGGGASRWGQMLRAEEDLLHSPLPQPPYPYRTTVDYLRLAGEIITLFTGILFFTSVSAWPRAFCLPSPPFPPALLPPLLPLPLSLSLLSLKQGFSV